MPSFAAIVRRRRFGPSPNPLAALSAADYAKLVGILARARLARYIGVVIPIDKLLTGEPI